MTIAIWFRACPEWQIKFRLKSHCTCVPNRLTNWLLMIGRSNHRFIETMGEEARAVRFGKYRLRASGGKMRPRAEGGTALMKQSACMDSPEFNSQRLTRS